MDLFKGPADHEVSVELTMGSDIPTGKTYLGFVLLLGVVIFVVALLCIVLFATGCVAAGISTILPIGYGFFLHSNSIGRRAARIIRRPSLKLRRILASDQPQKIIEDSSR